MAKAKAAKANAQRSKSKQRNESGPVSVGQAKAGSEEAASAEADAEEESQDSASAENLGSEDADASASGTESETGEGEDTSEQDFEPEDTTAYLKGLVESILFVADRPLDLKDLARAVRIDKKRCQELLDSLREDYRARGVYLEDVSGGVAFRTNPLYAEQVRKFLAQRPVRLSRAQLETLAIVAYRQPITRPEVDDIRGVDCGPVLKGLLERDLIRVLGKKDEPGRPMLYGTSPQFLELFNLDTLSELPTLKEFTELSDDSRLVYENELGEDAPDGPVSLDEVLRGAADDESADGLEPGQADDEDDPARRPQADDPRDEDEDDEDDEDEDEDDDED